jgi:hypothetical protein
MLLFKAARGAKDFWNESHKTIATREEWEKRRPQLGAEFDSYHARLQVKPSKLVVRQQRKRKSRAVVLPALT